MSKRVCLIVLDGFGVAPAWGGNAIAMATMPNWKRWWQTYPHSLLTAHGSAVGLPGHEIGNSEVGHLTLGSGRVIPQDSTRINAMIADGSFYTNEILGNIFKEASRSKKPVHLMGLLTSASVHASFNHLQALLQFASHFKTVPIYLHLFSDGRDCGPDEGVELLTKLQALINQLGVGQVASITGRYYAMDRDHRWDRTQRTVECLLHGQGDVSNSPKKVFSFAYEQGKTDEFIPPTIIVNDQNQPISLIKDGDQVIFFNFRSDRARQISQLLLERLKRLRLYTFVPYTLNQDSKTEGRAEPIFTNDLVINGLAEYLSIKGLRQFHSAETEKYAHVTYFFNSGIEKELDKEERILISSPKVATYDATPAMSAQKITDTLIKVLNKRKHDFVVVNYANADMVGHTGNLPAAVEALDFLDKKLGEVINAGHDRGWWMVITADHGNAEEMINPLNGAINPDHTRNPVPLVIIPPKDTASIQLIPNGTLADVAPTILKILDLKSPEEMTGRNLLSLEENKNI